MEIQNAFQIQWDKTPYQAFTEYFFAKIPTHGSNLAIVDVDTGQAIFVHLACSMIGCTAVAVNGWGTVDEIWQVVDLAEATHLIVESQFMQKADDVRRKAQMRGGGRIKHVRAIDDVLTTDAIEAKRRLSRNPLVKEESTNKITIPRIPSPEDARPDVCSPLSDGSEAKENGTEEPTCESPTEPPTPLNPVAGQNPLLMFFTSGTTGLPKFSLSFLL
ncbi:unnamed protein product [Cylicocyclus nassatus]|uniref:AMP-dependent synthetase/ligase domain-containing protein n=1 Tax=Cylicocyclus nassatus TaxID=53992 RepID=A0AA36MH37_CYLNA|nr:unnamed protein product [Cylicocyclus nassatus]